MRWQGIALDCPLAPVAAAVVVAAALAAVAVAEYIQRRTVGPYADWPCVGTVDAVS